MRSLDAEVRGAFLRGTQSDDFMGEAKKTITCRTCWH